MGLRLAGLNGVGADGYIEKVDDLDILGAIINSGSANNGRVYVNDALQVVGDSYLGVNVFVTGRSELGLHLAVGTDTPSSACRTLINLSGDDARITSSFGKLILEGTALPIRTVAATNQGVSFVPATLVCHHTHALFNAAATTDEATIFTLPARSVIMGIAIVLDEKFVATSLTALTITVGLAGDQDGYVTVTGNLVSDAITTEYRTKGAYWTETLHGATVTGEAIIAYVTATGANLNTLTAGQVTFYITYYTY